MRSKLCDDGKHRILAKVVVPMGATELTAFALANPCFLNDTEAMNTFENLNKRQLFNIAKESVAYRGNDVDIATNCSKQVWTFRQIERAKAHVKMLFPEVD
jgi:hypothetical protein